MPEPAANRVAKNAPRVAINAKKLSGSISLLGARLDDVVLKDYRDTVDPDSPNVRLLEPRSDDTPYYVQYGWTAPAGETVALPGDDTVWTATGGPLTSGGKVTLSWDNGQGLTFLIDFAVDDDYMFTVRQSVKNAGGQPVALLPWSRVRRDYKPKTSGYYILHEGMLGFFDGSQQSYDHQPRRLMDHTVNFGESLNHRTHAIEPARRVGAGKAEAPRSRRQGREGRLRRRGS